MKAGLWQLVIWGVLVLILFRPVILTLVRVVARLRRASAARACSTNSPSTPTPKSSTQSPCPESLGAETSR